MLKNYYNFALLNAEVTIDEGGQQTYWKDVELTFYLRLLESRKFTTIRKIRQQTTSMGGLYIYCIYFTRGLRRCLSSDGRQCESLNSGIGNRTDSRAFLLCYNNNCVNCIGDGSPPHKRCARHEQGFFVMKRLLILSMLLLPFLTVESFAQDVIVKKDNSTILSKVIEINSSEIKYQKWSNQEGPIYSISITDVSCINYQNGESDKFNDVPQKAQTPTPSQTQTQTQTQVKTQTTAQTGKTTSEPSDKYIGYMKRDGKYLTLNGRTLSDNEVRNLVGEENYQTYLGAQKQIEASDIWDVIFWLSLAGATLCTLSSSEYALIPAIGLWVLNDISLACAFIFDGIGHGRMNWVADEFNNKQSNRYSFNIAPSIMKCSTQQLQNNYGVGLTMRVSF